MKRIALIILTIALALGGQAQSWHTDILGGDYRMRYVSQPDDYSGKVRSTIVRLLPKTDLCDTAILYIHGFNDYFFNAEMGERFVAHRYPFYAVDLRKYGRSLLPGQKHCQTRSLNEYFPDIDSAIVQIQRDGFRHVIINGHSTGGLIAAYYQSKTHNPAVAALILNSPFLDWNLGKYECFTGAVALLGKALPNIKISQSADSVYGESCYAGYHGEWRYNRDWKRFHSPDVSAGWVNAINSAQKWLKNHPRSIRVPVLLLYSSQSKTFDRWVPEANRADLVLDVKDIRKYGITLSPRITAVKVNGGMHDLLLSAPKIRNPLYTEIFNWLGSLPKH